MAIKVFGVVFIFVTKMRFNVDSLVSCIMLTSKLSTNSMCTQKHCGYARERRYSESSVSLGVVCPCLSIYCTATPCVNLIQIPIFVSASLGYLAVVVFFEKQFPFLLWYILDAYI